MINGEEVTFFKMESLLVVSRQKKIATKTQKFLKIATFLS